MIGTGTGWVWEAYDFMHRMGNGKMRCVFLLLCVCVLAFQTANAAADVATAVADQ